MRIRLRHFGGEDVSVSTDFLLLALEMNPTTHCDNFENEPVTFAMNPASEDDTDLDITGISAFGFHSCYYLELC